MKKWLVIMTVMMSTGFHAVAEEPPDIIIEHPCFFLGGVPVGDLCIDIDPLQPRAGDEITVTASKMNPSSCSQLFVSWYPSDIRIPADPELACVWVRESASLGRVHAGGYSLIFTVVGPGGSDIKAIILTVLLPPPVLIPFNGATQEGFTPTLDWDDVDGAVSYTLEYADNASFNGTTVISGITESQYTIPTPLTDGTYYWRVKAIAADGTQSSFSTSDSFVIIPTFTEWTALLLAIGMIGYLFWRKWWMHA